MEEIEGIITYGYHDGNLIIYSNRMDYNSALHGVKELSKYMYELKEMYNDVLVDFDIEFGLLKGGKNQYNIVVRLVKGKESKIYILSGKLKKINLRDFYKN
ncbi:MAG: hypothetical protein QXF15_03810 [Candidatus Aenigmatarchaeota archaeon]